MEGNKDIFKLCDKIRELEKEYKFSNKTGDSNVLRALKESYRIKLYADIDCTRESLLKFTDVHGEGKEIAYCDDVQKMDAERARKESSYFSGNSRQISNFGYIVREFTNEKGKVVEKKINKIRKNKPDQTLSMKISLKHVLQKFYKKNNHYKNNKVVKKEI